MSEEKELIEVLRRTKELFGPLYPVLVAPDGSVIDGKHRLEADPDWPRVTVDWLANPVDAKALRIIANVVRREVSAEGKAEALGEIAEMTGWKPKEIAEALGVSYQWVMKYIPDKYKERPGAGGPKRVLRRRTQEEAPEPEEVIPESSKVPEGAVPKAVTKLPEKSKEPSLEEKARELGVEFPKIEESLKIPEISREKPSSSMEPLLPKGELIILDEPEPDVLKDLDLWFLKPGDPLLMRFVEYCLDNKVYWKDAVKQALREFLERRGYKVRSPS